MPHQRRSGNFRIQQTPASQKLPSFNSTDNLNIIGTVAKSRLLRSLLSSISAILCIAQTWPDFDWKVWTQNNTKVMDVVALGLVKWRMLMYTVKNMKLTSLVKPCPALSSSSVLVFSTALTTPYRIELKALKAQSQSIKFISPLPQVAHHVTPQESAKLRHLKTNNGMLH